MLGWKLVVVVVFVLFILHRGGKRLLFLRSLEKRLLFLRRVELGLLLWSKVIFDHHRVDFPLTLALKSPTNTDCNKALLGLFKSLPARRLQVDSIIILLRELLVIL